MPDPDGACQPRGGRSKIVGRVLGSVGLKAGYVVLQFTVGALLARLLGPESLGLYAFTIAVAQLLSVVAQFGFPTSLVRHVAVGTESGAHGAIKAQLRTAITIAIAASATIVIAGLIWQYFSGAKRSEAPLLLGLFLVLPLALTGSLSGAIRGFGKVLLGQIPDQIIRPLFLLLPLAFLTILGKEVSAPDAMAMNILASLSALGLASWILWRTLPAPVRHASPSNSLSSDLWVTLPFLLLAGAQALNYHLDMLLLGILVPADQLGLYRVALQVSDGLQITLLAISTVIAPQIARLHAQNNLLGAAQLLVMSHRNAALIMLPLGLGIALLGQPLLNLVYGQAYAGAFTALAILSFGKIAYAMVGFAGLILSMLGRAGEAALLSVSSLLINATLNLLLIPRFGIEGAAMTSIIVQFLVNAAGLLYLHRKYGLDFSALGRNPKKFPSGESL